MRDAESGYYSAAVIDVDGNSIEAVYRPGNSVRAVKSKVKGPAMALLKTGSVVSKASKVNSVKPESVVSYRSAAKSEAKSRVSKAPTMVERETQYSGPTNVMQTKEQQPKKTDDGTKAAKTIVGTLLGAAAGAAIAYSMVKGDSQSSESDPSQHRSLARELLHLAASQTSAAAQPPAQEQAYRAIEGGPARSYYSEQDGRSTVSRSVASKNPRASTVYEGGSKYFTPAESVYLDESGRRASSGSVYSTREVQLPLRAIEYPPPLDRSNTFPCNPSTIVSSFADKPRHMDQESVYSSSTIKGSSKSKSHAGSHVSSSSRRSGATKSTVSARLVPLPESVEPTSTVFFDADETESSYITPDDSVSQVGSGGRPSYLHHSSRSHGSRRSKFDEPVKPSDSVSQVSSNMSHSSHRTVRAHGSGASMAASRVGNRRGSQVC